MATDPAPISGNPYRSQAPTPLPPTEPVPFHDELVTPHLTFWQQPWVQNLLPILSSLTIHLSIIILAILLIPPLMHYRRVVTEDQVVVPDAAFTDGPIGGIPNPGLGGDPNRPAAQDQFKDVTATSDGLAEKPSQTLTQELIKGGGSGDSSDQPSIFATGQTAGVGKGSGFGKGSGAGGENGDGGTLAPFGVPGGGGGIGPKFMGQGTGGKTKSIAFVCDASGSMMNKMLPLKNELKRTIDQLRSVQAFSVIFFADDKPQALSQQLSLASTQNKQKAYEFLENVATAGQTNPVPALELAFKQHPQLIFLLTDGDFPDNNAVLGRIRELEKNVSPPIKINTIAFVGDGDNDKEFIDILTTIAKESGGAFRKVSQDEVQ